jgi:hypothetical protein
MKKSLMDFFGSLSAKDWFDFFAMILGCAASVLFILGTITMTSKEIADADGGFMSSTGLSKSLSLQKQQFVYGAILLFFSFISQVIGWAIDKVKMQLKN